MNREEVKRLIRIMVATYPNFKPNDMSETVDIWATMLTDYDTRQVEAGLKAYILTDTTGFAPTPGQIIGMIRTASENPMDAMTPEQAWTLVYKAICNSNYNAQEEFEKLPKICQDLVGSADHLREYAAMNTSTVETVTQSNFLKDYRSAQERQKEYEKIPVPVREMIEATTQKMLEG